MINDYWKDRQAAALAKVTKKGRIAIEKQLRKYYRTAMNRTIADFESLYNKLLAESADGVTPTPADLYKLEKYWSMQGQLKMELQKLGDKMAGKMSRIFEINFFEVYHSLKIEGRSLFSTIDAEGAKALINSIWVADGKSFSQRIWANTQKLIETLNEGLLDCVITGKKTSQLKKVLQERFNVSYNQADSLVRTELAHVQTVAAEQRYKDYGLKEVQIWADADERRCDVCGKLHKKKFKIGEHVPIPAHPRCRCCIVPVVDE